jgi:hypothetical protein
MKICVELLDEGSPTWYQVEAIPLGNDVYEIVEENQMPDDRQWEFNKGDKVRCRLQKLHGGEYLVAYELSK